MYTFEDFKKEIGHGGEATFSYNHIEYSISRSSMEGPSGWFFSQVGENLESEFYTSMDELYVDVRIEERTLEDIFKTGKVDDITIY